MTDQEILNMCNDIFKKTLAYRMDSLKIDNNGKFKHIHSSKFLDEHPERKDSPEFTIEEEKEYWKMIEKIAKYLYT